MLFVTLILLAWAPWVTKNYAESKVIEYFEQRNLEFKQKGMLDTARTLNCPGCGIVSSSRILFGYSIFVKSDLEGRLEPLPEEYLVEEYFFVSALGTVHLYKAMIA